MGNFDFDEPIDRRAVPALKTHPLVLGADGDHLFPAGVADMDFKAPPPVLDALSRRVAHGVFGYEAAPDGLLPALRDWLRSRHGWAVPAEQILQAPNVLNALSMAVNLFTREGDGIIVQPPVFFDFFDIIAENKRALVTHPLVLEDGRYRMDFEALEQLAAEPRTRMLLLCNPHNPVGRVWTRDELARLGEICRAHDVLVVADEIHADLVFPGHTYTPFAAVSDADARNSITCVSPAKTFNIPACSAAFTIIPDALRRTKFQAENSRLNVNKNNAFASVAMEAAYREGGPWLDAVLDYIGGNSGSNRALVRERLADVPGVELIEPEGTTLLWLDFRGLGLDTDALTRFLRERAGWAITRGVAFGEQGRGFGRLNIACPRAQLAAALDRLAAAVLEAAPTAS
ncbi:aminotransferase [Acidihalobacter ferrooxydans]|uniref:cysteine-S-conjugate beta-lyase n=1 Tax=Acidihalobacter ferrooxydans TaxID=1765967 RepID=A0A1P8UL58_9GAMM|nr:aminotransferase [Acidihalobacter ferrooxydans]